MARLSATRQRLIGVCDEHQQRGYCFGRTSKKRPGQEGAGRPTGWNGSPDPQVAALPFRPPMLRAQFNATTTSVDSCLIIVNFHVAGVR